jgi:hypothetical protein
MCKCIDIEYGTYENTILLGYYPIMAEYQKNRIKAGLSGRGITVDRCIADQIIELWENDIRTYGSCCGHNKGRGYINVRESFDKAISLGWKKYTFKNDLTRCDTVLTK